MSNMVAPQPSGDSPIERRERVLHVLYRLSGGVAKGQLISAKRIAEASGLEVRAVIAALDYWHDKGAVDLKKAFQEVADVRMTALGVDMCERPENQSNSTGVVIHQTVNNNVKGTFAGLFSNNTASLGKRGSSWIGALFKVVLRLVGIGNKGGV